MHQCYSGGICLPLYYKIYMSLTTCACTIYVYCNMCMHTMCLLLVYVYYTIYMSTATCACTIYVSYNMCMHNMSTTGICLLLYCKIRAYARCNRHTYMLSIDIYRRIYMYTWCDDIRTYTRCNRHTCIYTL